MRRLVYVVTASLSAQQLLRGQLDYFRRMGFDVHLISGDDEFLVDIHQREGVAVHLVPMAREIDLKKDWASLMALKQKMRELKPDLVNASTPKGGMLGTLAAWLAGVPRRVYVIRGLRLETTNGLMRRILTFTEKLTCKKATVVVCNSPSLQAATLANGLMRRDHSRIIVSCNGVMVDRFLPKPELIEEAKAIRARLGIPEDAYIVGFVGRFTKDKGINELVEAFETAKALVPNLALFLVGRFEEGDPVPEETRKAIETHPSVYLAGYMKDTAPSYHVMDVLVLPSYREGFPNVPVEAGSAGKPSIVSDATGCVDAVVDEVTGLVVPVRDAAALAKAMVRLASDRALSEQLGKAAQERASREFPPEKVWKQLGDLYSEIW